MRVRRAVLLVGAAVFVAGFVAASAAWACTNFIRIDQLTAATEAGVTTATVHGAGAQSNATVELRWNALDGPVVGRGQADAQGAFSASVNVPDVPTGIYTIIASDGKTPVGRAAYEVGSSAGSLTQVERGADSMALGSAAKLGVGILALGLVALTGALAVATGRRRVAGAVA